MSEFNHLTALNTTDKLLLAILKKQISVSVDTGDLVLNTDDLESLLQGINGSVETPDYSRVSDAVGLSAGFFSVTIYNVGAAAGTVLGVTLPIGDKISFEAKTGNTLGAIAYNATGTTFAIITTKIV